MILTVVITEVGPDDNGPDRWRAQLLTTHRTNGLFVEALDPIDALRGIADKLREAERHYETIDAIDSEDS